MSKNPVEEFLQTKEAFGMGGLKNVAKSYGPRAAESIGGGVAMGLGGAAFAGLTVGAAKLFDAATKTRDFNSMMEANPDLHSLHQEDPVGFNRMFSALRTMAPQFTKEPLVAGAYVRQGMLGSVEDRGFTAVKAMEGSTKTPRPGPVTEAAIGGFGRGTGLDRKVQGQTKTTYSPGSEGAVEKVEDTVNRFG